MYNITNEKIQALTNEKSYQRGLKYYNQGRVSKFAGKKNAFSAEVIGTDFYPVEVDFKCLYFDCTCPVMKRGLICKHLVALLLTILHGVVKPKKPIKVKKRHGQAADVKKEKIENVLKKSTKAELIQILTGIDRAYPEIADIIRRSLIQRDDEFYKSIQKDIKKMITGMKRLGYSRGYFHKLHDRCSELQVLCESLPVDINTTELLLNSGYLLEQALLTIDDSHGVVQDTIRTVVDHAVKGIEIENDLNILFKYTAMKSEFDYPLTAIESFLEENDSKNMKMEILNKLDRHRFKLDPEFNFPPKYGYRLISHCLLVYDPDRFEEFAEEVYAEDSSIAKHYADVKYKDKNYREFIEIIWEKRNWYNDSNKIIHALKAIKDYDKLIDFRLEDMKFNIRRTQFLELMKDIKKHQPEKEMEIIGRVENGLTQLELIKFKFTIGHIETGMNAIKYIEEKDNSFLDENYLFNLALMLSFWYQKESAVIYNILIKRELGKISRSNVYRNLFYYLEELAELSELDKYSHLQVELLEKYPGKKKLHEGLRKIFNKKPKTTRPDWEFN